MKFNENVVDLLCNVTNAIDQSFTMSITSL